MFKLNLTKDEKRWVLYDVGNSAFTMLITTILPIYFNALAEGAGISEVDYLAYWGYAASVATLVVALIGPIMGTLADTKNFRKPLFLLTVLIGAVFCVGMIVPKNWLIFLVVYVISKIAYNASLILYDAMLVDVTTEEKMDVVSSHGYAWGYIGSCIPFVASIAIVLMNTKIGISMTMAMGIAFFINAAWWVVMSIPLLKNYKQRHYVELPEKPVKSSFARLGRTLVDMKEHKNIFVFLIAFFFFIDGVYTIISMATAYGKSLGLDSTGLLLALLVTQVVAFPCALIFSRLSKKHSTDKLLKVCIGAYIGIAIFAIQLDKQWEFWFLAVLVGMFQGAIQALSRSYFAKIIPAEKSGEYFGIYDICGKGATFMGTALVGGVAQITGVQNAGVAVVAVMFVIGFFLFCKAAKLNREVEESKN